MDKSIEDMYQALLDQEASAISSPLMGPRKIYDQEEDEGFITSKEIVKQKQIERQIAEDHGITLGRTGIPVIEEELHFKRYRRTVEHKYTEKELAEIRESCVATIVHDYSENDIYHMSDEDRAKNDMLSGISLKLAAVRKTYYKVDQYVEAMRTVVEAWKIFAKSNVLHTESEFYELVSQGKIISNQIIMPKLKRMNDYNVDLLIKYISNPELDAKDLLPDQRDADDEFDDEEDVETDEERMERLLSPAEVDYILKYADNPPDMQVKDVSQKMIRGYDRSNYFNRKKKKSKVSKSKQYSTDTLHRLLNRIQSNPLNSGSSYASMILTHSMFEKDTDDKPKEFWDDVYFDGSWADDDAVFLYDLVMREELMKQHPPRESYLTYGDKALAEFFKVLEDNGINTVKLRRRMNATQESMSKAEQHRTKKENRKLEARLLQRITELNENPKFKKIVSKVEKQLNKQFEGD